MNFIPLAPGFVLNLDDISYTSRPESGKGLIVYLRRNSALALNEEQAQKLLDRIGQKAPDPQAEQKAYRSSWVHYASNDLQRIRPEFSGPESIGYDREDRAERDAGGRQE
jgi:hypothetical protein